jgi:hypothetical protein
MLDASPEVVEHIKAVEQLLQGLGDVILSTTELEETKIVAGIIVREALEQHVEFASFWASDKVQSSAPNFPTDSGPAWIGKFQSFLDTLGDLALANPITDPSIVYPVSMMASDAFRWVSQDEGVPVAIVQHDLLTIMLPEDRLMDAQFLDVPIAHIRNAKTRPSAPLHDSQSRETSHKPWDLILELEHDSWTYLINSSKRTANELTVLFRRSEDARECEMAIRELQQTTDKVYKQPRILSATLESPRLSANHTAQRIVYRSSPIEINRRQPLRSYVEEEQASSDQLGNTPNNRGKTSQRSLAHLPVKAESQIPERQQRVLRPIPSKPIHVPGDNEATHGPEQVEAKKKGSTQEPTKVNTSQAQKRLQDPHNETRAKPSETSDVQTQNGLIRTSAESSDGVQSPTESLNSESGSSKQTHGKGKLPKVSQTAKQRSSQQPRKDLDIFEIPNEDHRNATAKRQNITGDDPRAGPNSRTKSKKTIASSQAHRSVNHGRQTRSKRRAEDDDDFVPVTKSTKKVATERKSVDGATVTSKLPAKKVKTNHKTSTKSAPNAVKASSSRSGVQHTSDSHDEQKDKIKALPEESDKQCSSAVLSRTSLLGGLLGSQKPATATKEAFKKPALPTRAQLLPSTPTQHRPLPVMSTARPQTPNHRQKPSNTYNAIMSSPTPDDIPDGEYLGSQHDAVLSSNSKPTPASPNAESTAISGHADCDDVDIEKRQGDVQLARQDPFQQRRGGHRQTSFIRRLTGDDSVDDKPASLKASPHTDMYMTEAVVIAEAEDFPVKAAERLLPPERPTLQSPRSKRKAVECIGDSRSTPRKRPNLSVAQHSSTHIGHSPVISQEATPARERGAATDVEGSICAGSLQAIDNSRNSKHAVELHNEADEDATLVNDDDPNEQLPTCRVMDPNFHSSSVAGTPSSHSSTSAAEESSPQPSLPTSEAEEMEWEASLQPHQRSLHDMLMRVSNRVLRHVVDNETAVTDIAEMYENDGEHVLKDVFERQDKKYNEVWDDMDVKKAVLKKEMEKSTRALAKERQRINSLK